MVNLKNEGRLARSQLLREESELQTLDHSKKYLYDFIRMLADPYPNAFIRFGKKKIVFKDAIYDGKRLEFKGEIV